MPDRTTPTDLEGRRAVAPPATLVGLPLMLTVAEAAEVLRVSRTSAYKLAEEWRCTQGASGLPTVRLGSRIVVRRVDPPPSSGSTPPADEQLVLRMEP